tara:strand:+ start:215 stop:502 length:288 start_codon:yes stop_codon:yes gene_type:complete
MSKIRLVVRSTAELNEEIAKKKEALLNVRADLEAARKRMDSLRRDFHEAQMDVRTFTDLKDTFEERLGELQFFLGQNDIYEQMVDQGIIAEPVED